MKTMSTVAVLTSLHCVMVVAMMMVAVVQVENLQVSEAVMRMTLVMVSYALPLIDDRPLHSRTPPLIRNQLTMVAAIDFATSLDSMAESLVAVDRFVVKVVRDMDGRTFVCVAVLFLIERPMHLHFLERQIEQASSRGKSAMVNVNAVRVVVDPLGHCNKKEKKGTFIRSNFDGLLCYA